MERQTMCSCLMCKSGRCGICLPGVTSDFSIIDHGLIKSEQDVLKLDIIDWNRLNGYWKNSSDALHTIASWFRGHTHYTIMGADLKAAPARDDFPGWDHVGNHEHYGRLYWNWFHHNQGGELHFSDSPDFYGTLDDDKLFWGDIGKVSPSAFAHTQKHMREGDIWISIVDTRRQIILEPSLSIIELWESTILPNSREDIAKDIETSKAEQLRLF